MNIMFVMMINSNLLMMNYTNESVIRLGILICFNRLAIITNYTNETVQVSQSVEQ